MIKIHPNGEGVTISKLTSVLVLAGLIISPVAFVYTSDAYNDADRAAIKTEVAVNKTNIANFERKIDDLKEDIRDINDNVKDIKNYLNIK